MFLEPGTANALGSFLCCGGFVSRRFATSSLLAAALMSAPLTGVLASGAPAGATSTPSCSSLTQKVLVADGYTKATKPKITPYNYKKLSANAANALGTTIDFGAKALVVGCVSPSDIAKLSVIAQGKKKPTMTAQQYMHYLVKQSAGAMTKTKVGPVYDYLDFGNGKEDGLGSTSTASSVRLDAWVAGKFIVLTFSAPVVTPAPAKLVNFIKTTLKDL
jgi:hypothetical protein